MSWMFNLKAFSKYFISGLLVLLLLTLCKLHIVELLTKAIESDIHN